MSVRSLFFTQKISNYDCRVANIPDNVRPRRATQDYARQTPLYELLGPPVRAPRMWGVERDPKASLGSRGARGDGTLVVF